MTAPKGIEQAIAVPRALVDNFGGKPATPEQVATALHLAPDKVLDDMRCCGAAIIHIDQEPESSENDDAHSVNPNVLIEIGIARGLYGRHFILLVKDGVKLPSNLQGLYEVRYQGESLDSDATIRLLEAINDIKNHPLPTRPVTADGSKGAA